MLKRLNNKKGFTIIEIMVVIAIIGILAVVLVPQFAGVKDRARDTGVTTNARMVEAYVSSIIDDWTAADSIGTTPGSGDMIQQINQHFTTNAMTNPYTGAEGIGNIVIQDGDTFSTGASGAADEGVIYVVIDDSGTNLRVFINGFDSTGAEIRNTRKEVTQ